MQSPLENVLSESDAALRRVLEQSLLLSDQAQTVIACENLASLAAIAVRHRYQPLHLEPILFEMVDAMLRSIYQVGDEASGFPAAMVGAIAGSMWEDESSRERLERMWRRLCEEAI